MPRIPPDHALSNRAAERGTRLAASRSVLVDLIAQTRALATVGDLSVEISGISTDSRSLEPGELFIACRGERVDGRRFIAEAIAKGARAVVCEPPAPAALGVPLVLVADARRAAADLACAFHGHPSRDVGLVGVTGTDGKTTTVHLIAAILNAAGLRTGLSSTVTVDYGGTSERNRSPQTTPLAPVVQRRLAEMRDAGVQVAVLEVSSHALATFRVHGCVFDCAVFTNLDPEHLDFHGSLVSYRAAKASLFAQLDRGPAKPWGRLAVVNQDDPSSAAMRAACSVPWIGFGLSRGAAIRAEIARTDLEGTVFRLLTPDGDAVVRTRLAGRHNVLNWLAAVAAARHFGATLDHVRQAAAEFAGVPGRLEALRCGQSFHVFVDFAHTPQALAATIGLLRQQIRGRLIVVFGQAGHRDPGNRRRMAAAVAERADLAVLTSDDPYDDDPQAIVDDLARWFALAGWRENQRFWKIVDRREAIAFAMGLGRPGDGVLLAGRGPEEETVIGGKRVPLADADVARQALSPSVGPPAA